MAGLGTSFLSSVVKQKQKSLTNLLVTIFDQKRQYLPDNRFFLFISRLMTGRKCQILPSRRNLLRVIFACTVAIITSP